MLAKFKNSQDTKSNFISAFIFQIVSTIVGFIVMQFVLKTYGVIIFGFSTSISQFAICINILEIGLGSALIQALYHPLYHGNVKGINNILTKTKRYFIKTGRFILIVSIVIVIVYSFSAKAHASLLTLIPLALIMLTGAMFEYVFIGRYRVLLTADKRVGVLINIQTIALIISAIIKVLMMWLNFDIVSMMAVATFIYIFRIIFVRSYIKKNYAYVDYNKQLVEPVNVDNFAVIIQNISNIAVINVPFIILYLFLGMEKVSIYAVYALIFNSVLSILTNVFMQAAIASFGHITAANDYDTLKRKSILFETLYITTMSTFYISTAVLMLPFVMLYTKTINEINYINPTLVILLTTYGIIYSLRVPSLTIIFATGHFKEALRGAIIEFMILISLSILFTLRFGFYGVFFGLICSGLFRTVDLILLSNNKILHNDIKGTLKTIIINFVFIIISILILRLPIVKSFDNWFSLIIYAIFVSILALITSFIVNVLFCADKTQINFTIIKNYLRKLNVRGSRKHDLFK